MKQAVTRTLMSGTAVWAALLLMLTLGAAQAQQAVVPGRSVGRIFLGMPRGDVWKVLQPPLRHRSVQSSALPAPHPSGLYTVDQWENNDHSLTILSRNAKVVQVEVDSPQFAAPGGVSVTMPFAVLRRRFPRMHMDQYLSRDVIGGQEVDSSEVMFYADDVERGVAFTIDTEDDATTYHDLPRLKPGSLIVHLPGRRALPVDPDPNSHITLEPRNRYDYLSEIRDWFAGGPHQKITKG